MAWLRIRNSSTALDAAQDVAVDDEHLHDEGLQFDLNRLLDRRRSLSVIGGAGLAALAACTVQAGNGTDSSSTTTAGTDGSCTVIPEETAGPYPADGSNGVNVLNASGIVRRDIRSSFGTASGVASGVPTEFVLTVVDTKNGCEPLVGAAVYLWHCDAAGLYSMYPSQIRTENYLRGVQETDDNGRVRFTSIFPGAYAGRWPHVHFEVYPSVAAATSVSNKLRSSQLALPQDVSEAVYANGAYAGSAQNLSTMSLSSDNVFSDGVSLQMASVSGSVTEGYVASLTVPV